MAMLFLKPETDTQRLLMKMAARFIRYCLKTNAKRKEAVPNLMITSMRVIRPTVLMPALRRQGQLVSAVLQVNITAQSLRLRQRLYTMQTVKFSR